VEGARGTPGAQVGRGAVAATGSPDRPLPGQAGTSPVGGTGFLASALIPRPALGQPRFGGQQGPPPPVLEPPAFLSLVAQGQSAVALTQGRDRKTALQKSGSAQLGSGRVCRVPRQTPTRRSHAQNHDPRSSP